MRQRAITRSSLLNSRRPWRRCHQPVVRQRGAALRPPTRHRLRRPATPRHSPQRSMEPARPGHPAGAKAGDMTLDQLATLTGFGAGWLLAVLAGATPLDAALSQLI